MSVQAVEWESVLLSSERAYCLQHERPSYRVRELTTVHKHAFWESARVPCACVCLCVCVCACKVSKKSWEINSSKVVCESWHLCQLHGLDCTVKNQLNECVDSLLPFFKLYLSVNRKTSIDLGLDDWTTRPVLYCNARIVCMKRIQLCSRMLSLQSCCVELRLLRLGLPLW